MQRIIWFLMLVAMARPSSVILAQSFDANEAAPVIKAVTSAASIYPYVARGGLITIWGTNLATVITDLTGWSGSTLPTILGGVQVSIGGKNAPLLYVSPTQIDAQVPFDTQTRSVLLTVFNGNFTSNDEEVSVRPIAPTIFSDATGGLVLKNSDFSLVRPDNPARAGDVLLIYSTGLGQTEPPLETGRVVTFPPHHRPFPMAVLIVQNQGNIQKSVEVIYSIAAPGFAGLYQTAVRVPSGLQPGKAELVITGPVPHFDYISSNPVNIAVQ